MGVFDWFLTLSPSLMILLGLVALLVLVALIALVVFLFCTWWSFFIEVPKQLKRIADVLEWEQQSRLADVLERIQDEGQKGQS